jgi:hypothetical protein
MTANDFSAEFGPRASYSDHKAGERIRYRGFRGAICSGKILYVSAPTVILGNQVPLQYAVMRDGEGASFPDFPDMVRQIDVLEDV